MVIGDFICEWKSQMIPKKRRVYFRGTYEEYGKKTLTVKIGQGTFQEIQSQEIGTFTDP